MEDLDFSPRVSLEESHRSLALSFPSLKIMSSFPRRSYSYSRLPSEPIKLSVLKLDGSLFHVQIMSSATIGDLKLAVEAVFSHMPKKGPGKISWSHVWRNFCLIYNGQKLVAETDCVSTYGIKDGDQLSFVNHVSSNSIPAKGHSKKSKQQKGSLFESKSCIEYEHKLDVIDPYDDIEKGKLRHHNEHENEMAAQRRGCAMFPSICKDWFSYSSLPGNEDEANYEDESLCDPHHLPTQGCNMFSGLGSLMRVCSGKGRSQRDTWKDN